MSHDLRSPLNSILGFSELLLRGMDGELNAADRAALVDIQRAGRRLLRLINEILDTAKCESGRMIVELRTVMPAEVLSQAVSEARRGAEPAPGVELTTELQPGMEPVDVDPVLLPQAVAHMLVFALGAARAGVVHVVARDQKTSRGRTFIVEVAWSGPPGDGEREGLFVGFRRAGPGDLGLALPLARRLVELHNGKLAFADGTEPKLVLTVSAQASQRLGILRRKAPASQPS
jgi:signal transduction histidine kinase